MKMQIAVLLVVFSLQTSGFAHDPRGEYLDQSGKDERRMVVRAIDAIEAAIWEIYTPLVRRLHSFSSYPSSTPSDVANAQGLMVMVHGLNSAPSQWWRHVKGLPKTLAAWSFFVPKVKDRGNCYLDEAVEPILAQMLLWAQSHPDKPVIIMGTSNGGRIALELMNQLRQSLPEDSRRIFMISLSGVIGGSRTLELAAMLGVERLLAREPIRNELMPGSKRIQKLYADARRTLQATNTDCLFLSLPTEMEVQIGSSLYTAPDFGPVAGEVRYLLLRGTGHSGAVLTSYPIIRQIVDEWSNNRSITKAELGHSHLILPSDSFNFPAALSSVLTLFVGPLSWRLSRMWSH